MGIACRQGRPPAAGRNVGDWPGSVSALAGDGPKALIDMRVAGDHKIHFGLMKKWQVSAMSPPRGMPADVEHRIMQIDNFPRRLRLHEILFRERKLFIRLLLIMEVERQEMDWTDI